MDVSYNSYKTRTPEKKLPNHYQICHRKDKLMNTLMHHGNHYSITQNYEKYNNYKI